MSRPVVSRHAYCRMRERVGGGRRAADRISVRVYEQGLRAAEVHGKLGRYMVARETAYPGSKVEARIYGDMIYLYGGSGDSRSLITLYRLPNSLVRQACAMWKRA